MKKIISRSEVVGLIHAAEKELEVCATVDASYDDASSQMIAELDSFLRPVDIRGKESHLAADWLPRKEIVRESTGPGDASSFARDIFQRWVKRIREAVPTTLHTV